MGTATALTAAVAWLDVKTGVPGALIGSDTGWAVAGTAGEAVTTGGDAREPGLIGGETGRRGTTGGWLG